MPSPPAARALAIALALLAPSCRSAPEDARPAVSDPAPQPVRPHESERAARLRSRFPDVTLVSQDGREHRFYDDLVRGRVVLVNFMYTSCRGT